MAVSHTLEARDQWFLEKNLCDPVTKAPFMVGDTIVICANCKVPHDVSTWGLDQTKQCASCQGNSLMEFDKFSPVIFRPRASNRTGFRVKEDKLPLRERLAEYNGYGWGYAAVVLLPLITAVLLFFSAYLQGMQPVETVQAMGMTAQTHLEQMAQRSEWKLSTFADGIVNRFSGQKPPDELGKLALKLDHIDGKLRMAASRFLSVLPAFQTVATKLDLIGEKLQTTLTNRALELEYMANRNGEKLERLFR